ncbi:MAG: hypothetical protein WCF12_07620 [Propionicimonas sp.]
MFIPRAAALGLLCPLALITACQQAPAVTPAPAPIVRCTPEAGGEEYDCSQAQHDEMVAKDRLYAEAEAVFRKFFAENVRISRAGGVEEATPVMLETSTGHYLNEAITTYRHLRQDQLLPRGRDPKVVSVDRLPGLSKGGSVVAMRTCIDASGWAFYRGTRETTRGFRAQDDVYFEYEAGQLKMFGADGKAVKEC